MVVDDALGGRDERELGAVDDAVIVDEARGGSTRRHMQSRRAQSRRARRLAERREPLVLTLRKVQLLPCNPRSYEKC